MATNEQSVLAPDLEIDDRIVSSGIGGVMGRVTALRISPGVVDVTTDDGMRHALGFFEVIRIERKTRPTEGTTCAHEDDGGPFFAKCQTEA
jgi:hypothetical protein